MSWPLWASAYLVVGVALMEIASHSTRARDDKTVQGGTYWMLLLLWPLVLIYGITELLRRIPWRPRD